MVVFTVQAVRFMEMLLERSAALAGLDEEVSDGRSITGCWSESQLSKAQSGHTPSGMRH